jgi:MFS family permease
MLSCFTALVAEFAGTDNKVGQGFAVFFLFAFVTCYGSCVDVVSWIYCSEIFPTHARARGFSLSVAGFLATAIVFTQPAAVAFTNIGWRYYLVFIIISFVGAPVFWYFSPETKGVSLEEIATLFGDEVASQTVRGALEDIEKDSQEEKAVIPQVEHIDQSESK